MWSNAREIAAGDVVIVWMTRDSIQPLTITPGRDFNSKYGNYKESDFIGIPYGSKVGARTGRGFIHLLRPTPELWTMALPHRTQILYLADIAFVVSHLNIGKGSKVIEAGTGSGSFSHSVARTIGKTGHLWSYEFHEVRAAKAEDEFARHGLSDIITLTHRNVCKDGFTVEDTVDAVFLDLPAPWSAIEHAKKALRKDHTTRICCFSPCMEQVLRTVTALNEHGFTEITMFETLIRPHEVTSVPALPKIGEVAERLKESERKREDKRLKQIEANQKQKEREAREKETEGKKRGHEETEGEGEEAAEEELAHKRVKTEETEDGQDVLMEDLVPGQAASSTSTPKPKPNTKTRLPQAKGRGKVEEDVDGERISLSSVFPEVRGHTSYLTFAVLQPYPGSSVSEDATPTPVEGQEAGVVETTETIVMMIKIDD